ncbi:hypothetical protein ACIBHX_41815 [Nonomuraea sp. NPDC050536]|uniref:hypothetical protein n=1 Tax=Nonomuraea sp. NPDC050536 TaxID=3364366 RepID=UPI0037CA54DB
MPYMLILYGKPPHPPPAVDSTGPAVGDTQGRGGRPPSRSQDPGGSEHDQAPDYPMQLVVNIYEFPRGERLARAYSKRFTIDYIRG